jgi:phage terminase Nu1 subunit (DNA packaging protein)
MPEMSDEEFIEFHKMFEGWKPGWDAKRFDCWWQDSNRRPNLVSKSQLAKLLDVSLQTVDSWIRRGAPVYQKGDHGVAYQIDTAPFLEWYFARSAEMSIDEYRRYDLEQAIKARKEDERRWALIENRQMKAQMQMLIEELSSLRREVRALKRSTK